MNTKPSQPYELRTETKKRPNQYTKNPKQEAFLEYYYDPTSETFANVLRSALRAGYSESYSRLLGAPSISNDWLRNNNKTSLTTDHITTLVERIAIKGRREGDQLRALELLAKMNGMVVERSQNLNVNIETALESLK